MSQSGALIGCRSNLLVSDLTASLKFYADVLGFRIGWRWSDPRARFLSDDERGGCDEPGTALVGRDQAQIFLTQVAGRHTTWLHFDVTDAARVDQLFQEWQARGAVIAEPPVPRPWGMYEMRLHDPDGHVLRFSSPPAGPPPTASRPDDHRSVVWMTTLVASRWPLISSWDRMSR